MTPRRFEEFSRAMAPTVQAMQALTDAVLAVEPRHHYEPSKGSQADEERGFEKVVVGRSRWDGPITDTHSMGGVTLLAAVDYARSFAELFTTPRTPVFGHSALARAALEASMVSGWLNQPGIEPWARVGRGLWEQVKSAAELAEAAREPSEHNDDETAERKQSERERAQERKARWRKVALDLGWQVQRKGKSDTSFSLVSAPDAEHHLVVCRPWPGVGIDELLLGDVLGPRDHDLRRSQWSYLGGVNHVVWFAMREAVQEPPAAEAGGPSLAGIGTNLYSVLMQALGAARAVRTAAERRFVLMGWADDEWRSVASGSERFEVDVLRQSKQLQRPSLTASINKVPDK
jgi:hypothetical protein